MKKRQAAIADEADIIIRSLESRVAKMEKSNASALKCCSIPIRLDSSGLPHGDVLMRTYLAYFGILWRTVQAL